jgi:hypothetical protein
VRLSYFEGIGARDEGNSNKTAGFGAAGRVLLLPNLDLPVYVKFCFFANLVANLVASSCWN